jgi:hypothetical protein
MSIHIGRVIYHDYIFHRTNNQRGNKRMVWILEGVIVTVFGAIELPSEGVLITFLF